MLVGNSLTVIQSRGFVKMLTIVNSHCGPGPHFILMVIVSKAHIGILFYLHEGFYEVVNYQTTVIVYICAQVDYYKMACVVCHQWSSSSS